jgi:hypothetical protein
MGVSAKIHRPHRISYRYAAYFGPIEFCVKKCDDVPLTKFVLVILKKCRIQNCKAKADLAVAYLISSIQLVLKNFCLIYTHEDSMLEQTSNAVPDWYR